MTLLSSEVRAEHLATLRITVFGIWLVNVARIPLTRFAEIPQALVEPPAIIGFLPVHELVSFHGFLFGFKAALLVLCALCILGLRPFPLVAVPTALLILLFDGLMKSIGGFTNHAQMASLFAAFVVAVSPAADAYSVVRPAGQSPRVPPRQPEAPWRYAFPFHLTALVICVAYSLIGTRRLVSGGIELFTGGSIEAWFVTRSLEHSDYGFELGLLVLHVPFFAGAMALMMFVTTVFEALSPLALRFPRFRLIWLVVILPFHVATLFTMNIFFWENLVLILVLFTGLSSIFERDQQGRLRPRPWDRVGSLRQRPGGPKAP